MLHSAKNEAVLSQKQVLFRRRLSKVATPRFAASLAWKIIRLVMILGLCFIILYPFVIKILSSFKSFSDFMDPTVRFVPKTPTFDNIVECIESMDYWNALKNTGIQSFAVGILQMLVCALIGYGLSRFHFRGRNIVFLCVILTLIIPPQTIMIPLFTRFRYFLGLPQGLIDTHWPMIILSLTGLGWKNGLYVFIFRQFFNNMPKELEEAASIDGCGSLGIFTRVMLPSAVPTMVMIFLFAFSWQWTDIFYNNLFYRDLPTLVTAIDLVGASGIEPIIYSMLRNTAAILAIIPLALIFIVAQRFFVQGIENSGIVG